MLRACYVITCMLNTTLAVVLTLFACSSNLQLIASLSYFMIIVCLEWKLNFDLTNLSYLLAYQVYQSSAQRLPKNFLIS